MASTHSSSPLVSVLIVAYNAGDYIIQTLDSVLAQSYSNIEVLILDNNSSDHTRDIIERYQRSDSRVQLKISSSNTGPYGWLNHLLLQARWKYIAIQDHDDIWHPDKLKYQVEFLENNQKYLGCGTQTMMYYEHDKTYFNYLLEQENYYTIHPSLMFRHTKDFRYDEELMYFADAYSQKYYLCEWQKKIYNIDKTLTCHIIKSGYSNATYSWFSLNMKHIGRIFDVHGYSFYAILVLNYEIFRKFLMMFQKHLSNQALFIYFDRLPYRLSGNQILPLSDIKDAYVQKIKDSFL